MVVLVLVKVDVSVLPGLVYVLVIVDVYGDVDPATVLTPVVIKVNVNVFPGFVYVLVRVEVIGMVDLGLVIVLVLVLVIVDVTALPKLVTVLVMVDVIVDVNLLVLRPTEDVSDVLDLDKGNVLINVEV